MALSKKHYVAIAKIITDARVKRSTVLGIGPRISPEGAYSCAVHLIAWDLAHYFGSQSAAFDKKRFLTACGVVEQHVQEEQR